jgi:hypothetical protein
MLVEVGNDIEKEKKSFKIAKKLLEMSKEVYED